MDEVGWCWTYGPLKHLGIEPEKLEQPEGASRLCPAVSDQFKNTYTIKSPHTIHMKFDKYVDGEASILLEKDSTIYDDKFSDIFNLKEAAGWQDPQTPRLQMHMGILFVTDTKDIEIEMLPPFLEYRPDRYPVTFSSAKFNIYNWVKELQLGLDWKDTSVDINIKRGDVLSYVRFNKNVKLKQIEYSEELEKEIITNIHSIRVAKNYTKKLMSIAGMKRRKKWL